MLLVLCLSDPSLPLVLSSHYFPPSFLSSLPGTPRQGPSRDVSSFMQARPTRARLTMLLRNSSLLRMEYTVPHCVCWHMKFINGLTRGASPVICWLAKRDSLQVEVLRLLPATWPAQLKWQISTHIVRFYHFACIMWLYVIVVWLSCDFLCDCHMIVMWFRWRGSCGWGTDDPGWREGRSLDQSNSWWARTAIMAMGGRAFGRHCFDLPCLYDWLYMKTHEAGWEAVVCVQTPTSHHTDQLAAIVELYGSISVAVTWLNREQLPCPTWMKIVTSCTHKAQNIRQHCPYVKASVQWDSKMKVAVFKFVQYPLWRCLKFIVLDNRSCTLPEALGSYSTSPFIQRKCRREGKCPTCTCDLTHK